MFFAPIAIFSRTFFQVTVTLGKGLWILLFCDFPTLHNLISLQASSQFLFKPSAYGLCNLCGYTVERWPRKHKEAENKVEY